MPPSSDHRRDVTFWATAIVLTAGAAAWLTRHMTLLQWDNDEGLFAMVGLAVADGHRLYSEAWIDHPPGTSVALAAAFRAFGATLPVARGTTLALTLPGLLAVAVLARRLGGPAAGIAAILLLVLSPHFFWLSRSINQDLPSMAFGVCALAAVWHAADGGRRAWLGLGGLLLGLGLSLKLSPVVVAAPIAVLLVARGRRIAADARQQTPVGAAGWPVVAASGRPAAGATTDAGDRRRTAAAALTVLARDAATLAVPLAAVVAAWFLAAPPDRVAYSVFGTVAAARRAFPDRSAEYADWLVRENLLDENLGLTLLAAAGLAWLARRQPTAAAAMGAWCAVTGWSLITQRPMWPKHHWSLVLWPLAILAGAGLAASAGSVAGGLRRIRRRGGPRPLANDRAIDPMKKGGPDPARESGGSPPAARAGHAALGGLALAAWLATTPDTAARLAALVEPKQFGAMAYGAEWLARHTPPGTAVISDSGMVAFLAGRRIPPGVATVSSKRIRIGDLTGADLVAAAESPGVAAVLFWNDQLQDFPDFMAWLPTRFVRAERVGDSREIWRRFDPAEVRIRQPATVFDVAMLEGFDFGGAGEVTARRGARVPLTLYWRAAGPTPADLTVFVHLADPTDRTVAQADGPPAGGEWPSSAWVPGQIVIDHRELAIPWDAAPGTYRVRVGFYDPATAARAGAGRPDGTLWPDGAVELSGEIVVTE